MPHLCRNGRCRNTPGSFQCECASGYVLSSDGQHCRDIDECHEVPNTCPSPGRCQNLMGSYACICPDGYKLAEDRNTCIDIDECETNPEICEDGECTNTPGAMLCTCPEGYITSDTGMKCIDVRQDQCYDEGYQERCGNPRGMFITAMECCCSRGMAWGRDCQACPREGTPEFAKLCPEGAGRMVSGKDLDECALMPGVCEGGDCINTDGSFRCDCPPGYTLDSTGHKCIDDNECMSQNNICGNGTCSNLIGSFECGCNEGFTPGAMQICEDVNECLESSNGCAFRCHNVPGSYRCICPYGFVLSPDGRHCTGK